MFPWAKRLNEALEKKGWSITLLAEKSGVEYNSVTKYLKGKVKNPRGNTRKALADALDVPLDWLENGTKSGYSDRGAKWDADAPERHEEPVYYQDWSGEVPVKVFQRFVKPLVAELLSDAAANSLKADFYKRETEDCLKWLEACRYDDGATPPTEHIAEYLTMMALRLDRSKKAERNHKRWWQVARDTARLIVGPAR